jgi:AAA family ATP:ADP antiporter
MYQAKAWIDMFGYRLFKALGALIIIGLSQWTLSGHGVVNLGWVVLLGCCIWAWVLVTLNREYQALALQEQNEQVACNTVEASG